MGPEIENNDLICRECILATRALSVVAVILGIVTVVLYLPAG